MLQPIVNAQACLTSYEPGTLGPGFHWEQRAVDLDTAFVKGVELVLYELRQVDASARCPRERKPELVRRGGAEGVNIADVDIPLIRSGLIDSPRNVAAWVVTLHVPDKEEGHRRMVLVAENLVILAQVFVCCQRGAVDASVSSATGRGA